MDLATVIGIIVGALLILTAILLGGDIGAYIDPASVLIVVGAAWPRR